MHYLLYFPERTGSDTNMLVEAGLGDLLREGEAGPEFTHHDHGPDGKGGTICTWCNPAGERPPLAITKNQTWIPAPKLNHPDLGMLPENRYWLGIFNDDPPQPCDLARTHMVPGFQITFADQFAWNVPTLSRLPNRYSIDGETGDITRVVREKYKKFYDTGMKIVGEMFEEFGKIEEARDQYPELEDYSIPVNIQGGVLLLAAALNLNYRLTYDICFLLEMMDEQSTAMAIMYYCELPQMHLTLETVKKKECPPVLIPVGWYSSNGSQD